MKSFGFSIFSSYFLHMKIFEWVLRLNCRGKSLKTSALIQNTFNIIISSSSCPHVMSNLSFFHNTELH